MLVLTLLSRGDHSLAGTKDAHFVVVQQRPESNIFPDVYFASLVMARDAD